MVSFHPEVNGLVELNLKKKKKKKKKFDEKNQPI